MADSKDRQTVLVLDFGAQYAQLIARRIRDLNVYSEVVPCDIDAEEIKKIDPAALVLSGGPASVYEPGSPQVDPHIFELGLPVLGFCYGHQIMAVTLGGSVKSAEVGEYGPVTMTLTDVSSSLLFDAPSSMQVWMSHRDSVECAPSGFVVTAKTDHCLVAAMEDKTRKFYGTQFHPEVRHTPWGNNLLSHFLFDVCKLTPSWHMGDFIEETIKDIRAKVGNRKAILGLSGGVDSAVVAKLCARAIGKQLTCVFVNHGLLRQGEPEEVEVVFSKDDDLNFVHVHAQDRFLSALQGITDPEQKRRIIGSEFWKIFFEEAKRLDGVEFLAQGTIYPDIIESGSRKTSGKGSAIKSHHNLIPFPEGVSFELIEPLDHLFKDEVRALGEALGLPESLVWRQPFPGPGLAVRVIGEVAQERLSLLKAADAIVREELDAYNASLFEKTGIRNASGSVWQYFAVLPDIRSVGVMGDERTYGHTIVVRAVESADAMTADWARLPYEVLGRISSRIVAEVKGVNRVVYDVTSKPPATIEWE
ncbi:MAG: glutamine-hydrolyzing GMP synthase [Eggerthellaceae bacterium]|nr:glutamine-hydrolyzing GMP synthase [Eggerthellaceae bacterium]